MYTYTYIYTHIHSGECQWNEIPKSTSGTLRQGIQGSRGLPYAVPVHKFQARVPAGADQRDSGYQKLGVPVVSAAAPASGPRADTKAPCDASWSGVLNHDRRCKSIEDPACDFTSRSTRRSGKQRRRTDDVFFFFLFLFLEEPEETRAEREEREDHLGIFQANSVSATEMNFGNKLIFSKKKTIPLILATKSTSHARRIRQTITRG